MLVAVHPDSVVVLPREIGCTAVHTQAMRTLYEVRDSVAPLGLLAHRDAR